MMVVFAARPPCPVYPAVPLKWPRPSVMKNMAPANIPEESWQDRSAHSPFSSLLSPPFSSQSSIAQCGLSSSAFLLWKGLDWWVIGCCWAKDRLQWLHSLLQDWGRMSGGLDFHSCSSWHPSPPETPPDIYFFVLFFFQDLGLYDV